MSMLGQKTSKFFLYIFSLGTLILILDSYAEPIHKPDPKCDKDHPLCPFHQTHLPRQAIEYALYTRGEITEYLLRKTLTRRPREYAIRFFVADQDASDETTKLVTESSSRNR
ncbi:uncharacterized protein LOC143210148 [Lasioglossum baleicum]|uniref:uncharacterized protein LOC143210148 n=1 Tax=Lasioglossum baleicum TaxID=434251 RepID=UPI003FCDE55F